MGLVQQAAYIAGDAIPSTTSVRTSGTTNPYPGVQRTEVVPISYKRAAEREVSVQPPTKKLAILDSPAVPAAAAPPTPELTHHTRSRKGVGICEGFQSGQCTITNANNTCPKDGTSLHICSICRRTGHGSSNPRCFTANPAPQPAGDARGRGAGRGAGRRRGRGGKGGKQ